MSVGYAKPAGGAVGKDGKDVSSKDGSENFKKSRRSNTFTVKAHKPAEWYHMARLKVTGPVTGDTSQCRFWYQQGSVKYQQDSVKYRQDLRCVNQLRLAKK
ncbi:hypothetical protein [Streptomyces mirabilis]|uniref:hypothetical protein n=1 Tax=Streptomyces mirabilis TaxID=68239 RepID=UPI0036DF733C